MCTYGFFLLAFSLKMSTPRRAVRPLDPLRIWLGNLSHGLSRHSLLMALAQLGMHPEEVALYHQHNGRNSAAVLRFEDAAGASAAMGRLNGLHHEGLQGRGRPQALKARHAFATVAAAGAHLAAASEGRSPTPESNEQPAPVITLASSVIKLPKAQAPWAPQVVPPQLGCRAVQGLVQLPSATRPVAKSSVAPPAPMPSVTPSMAPSVGGVKRERQRSRSPTPPWHRPKE